MSILNYFQKKQKDPKENNKVRIDREEDQPFQCWMVWSHILRYLISQLIIGLFSLNFPDLTHFIVVFLCRRRQTWGTDCRRTTWQHASYSASMSCHFGFEEKVVEQKHLFCGFMRGARLKLAASRTLITVWSTGEAMNKVLWTRWQGELFWNAW